MVHQMVRLEPMVGKQKQACADAPNSRSNDALLFADGGQHKLLYKILVDATVLCELRVEARDHDAVGSGSNDGAALLSLHLRRVPHSCQHPDTVAHLQNRRRSDEDCGEVSEGSTASSILSTGGVIGQGGCLERLCLSPEVVAASRNSEPPHLHAVLAPLLIRACDAR